MTSLCSLKYVVVLNKYIIHLINLFSLSKVIPMQTPAACSCMSSITHNNTKPFIFSPKNPRLLQHFQVCLVLEEQEIAQGRAVGAQRRPSSWFCGARLARHRRRHCNRWRSTGQVRRGVQMEQANPEEVPWCGSSPASAVVAAVHSQPLQRKMAPSSCLVLAFSLPPAQVLQPAAKSLPVRPGPSIRSGRS